MTKTYPTYAGKNLSREEAMKMANMTGEEFDTAEKISKSIARVLASAESISYPVLISISQLSDEAFHWVWNHSTASAEDLATIQMEYGVGPAQAKVIYAWVVATVKAMLAEVNRGNLDLQYAKDLTHKFSTETKAALSDTIGEPVGHA